MGLIFAIAAVIFVTIYILLRRAGGGSFPWIQFYTKGKESGFTFKEINLLRKVAVENYLENPTSLFWSIKQLDKSIRGMVVKFRSQGVTETENSVYFLSKLFEFRKKIELNQPKYTLGLKTTRKMDPRQRLRIMLPDGSTYFSTLVENLRKYLAVSYPQGPTLPPGFSWKGSKLNVYFWRQEDAGYVFETRVIDDFYEQKYPILHILHSDSITRSQKRNSVRVNTNRVAMLWLFRNIDAVTEEAEEAPGLRCRLMDLSECGFSVLIGGRAKLGLPVKTQFMLGNEKIVMRGIVKGLSYNQQKNQSILHVQALPPSFKIKNRILIYVYNLFHERDKELGSIKK